MLSGPGVGLGNDRGAKRAADVAYWRIGAGRLAAQSTEAAIRAALASGKGILKVARDLETGSSVVQRIKAEAVGAPG
jgi:hypothetical protein